MPAATYSNDRAKPSVLVIDDEPDLRTLYELSLLRDGYEVITAESLAVAYAALDERSYDVIVSDMRLPDGLGLEMLKRIAEEKRGERCIVITAYGSAENAVEALKAGAFDYLSKPVDLRQFRMVVAQAVQLNKSEVALPPARNLNLSTTDGRRSEVAAAHQSTALAAIVGQSPAMIQLRERVSKVARSMAPVLVRGESGTGKELVARAIHGCSHRSDGPFVAVNCGAIPEHLLEAEFFGARKGAYTGSTYDREGYFQAANSGTLFLDEIGDLPLAMQAKLLRAIQERVVRPIGGTQEVPVNARIVSATHKDLAAAVAAGEFRQDLYYRVNVIDIAVPALRDRMGDLPELVQHLLQRISQSNGEACPHASAEFLHLLQDLPLKGNVRELENLLHRAVALSDGESLSIEAITGDGAAGHLGSDRAQDRQSFAPDLAELPRDLQAHLDQQEKAILLKALQDTGFNRTAAAAKLGINLRQIRYRMSRLGIDAHEAKG
jgi:two-component system, NtrC family, response regulator PilR